MNPVIEGTLILILAFFTFNWFFRKVLASFFRDLDPIALKQQSNIGAVRKKEESAIYRNFLIPNGLPLVSGLNLSNGYKLRNGNFADLWSAIMKTSSKDAAAYSSMKFINTNDTSYSLPRINHISNMVLEKLQPYVHNSPREIKVGIAMPLSTFEGFVSAIAIMKANILWPVVPIFFHSVPRQSIDKMDVLIVDTWDTFKLFSEHSFSNCSNILVWESINNFPGNINHNRVNVESLHDCSTTLVEDPNYEYIFDTSKISDDHKVFAYLMSPKSQITKFMQTSLMSSVGSFIKSFPLNQQLTAEDSLTIISNKLSPGLLFNQLDKIFSVLLFGGSLSFIDASQQFSLNALKDTTLLSVNSNSLYKVKSAVQNVSQDDVITFLNDTVLSWAISFFSHGVFTTIGESNSKFSKKLRCMYINDVYQKSNQVCSYSSKFPPFKNNSSKQQATLTTKEMNTLRAKFGSRLVLELIIPYLTIGPIAQKNFYDYRVLPDGVENQLTCYGPLSSSIEGKMLSVASAPNLKVSKRQGMLCIRGFNIGIPTEEDRLNNAINLGAQFGGEDGWMPLVGVYGLWGLDGCLYLFN